MDGQSRRRFLAAASLAGLGTLGSMAAGCSRRPVDGGVTEDTTGLTPSQALAKLKEGNARFVAMKETHPDLSAARLMSVSKAQKPFVGVLGCVDSRVPPELVFDRGLGDVFDARIAGAIADDAAIGSLEFGVDEFAIPLLVVLGHSRCGAVTATVKALGAGSSQQPGRIGTVVDAIVPAVKSVEAQGIRGDDIIPAATREVIRRGVTQLRASPVLKDRLAAGVLDITGAYYDLDTGAVEFFS